MCSWWRTRQERAATSAPTWSQRITLAARHRLPAVYASRYFVIDGGLISCWLTCAATKPFKHLRDVGLQIPTHSGQVFRIDAGRDSDLKPATIPR
jgi:hypothetical protein